MARVLELAGLIYGKYERESKLAAELGWPRQRLNKIVNGKKEPDLEEIAALAGKLGLTIEETCHIFLRAKSPNEQHATA